MPPTKPTHLSAEALKAMKHDLFVLERLMRSMLDGTTTDVVSADTAELMNELIPACESHIDAIDKIIL